MSLLMDALKRAEKARQAQAEKNTEAEGMSTSKLALDPIEDEAPSTGSPEDPSSSGQQPASAPPGPAADEPAAPSGPPSSPRANPATTHFSLSDDFPATEKVPPPTPSAEEPETQNEGEKLGPFSLVRDNELSLEDTGEMLPVVKEAEKSLNDYFDEPDSAPTTTASPADTAGGEDSTVLGERGAREERESLGKHAAQSVFKAKAPAVARYQRNRTLMIALPLLLLAGVVIGVLLFWNQIERTFFGSPPVLVQRPPGATEITPPPESVAGVAPSKLVAAAEAASAGQPAPEPAPSPAADGSGGSAPESVAVGAEGAAAPVDVKTVAAAPEAVAVTSAPISGSLESEQAKSAPPRAPAQRPAFPQAPVTAARPFAAAAPSGGVRISRRSKPDRVHAGINEAYDAFMRGDYAAARVLYAEVKRQHPNNRNALLGLGAIAVRGGHYSEAVRHYARLLSINPRDPVAGAALINLNQRVPAGEGESHVKRLLAEDPEQPLLYFTLGNLFARQDRWIEAQQAYFDAYRRDSNSADFAFNLAVSLDQLGQSAAALTYYQRALMLAAEGAASFEPRAAKMRIDRLTHGDQG